MEVCASKKYAELAEGLPGSGATDSDVNFAKFTCPDGRVSGFCDDGKVRGASSTVCQYCGTPVERGEGHQSCVPCPVTCPACGEVANSKECSKLRPADGNLKKEMEAKP